MKIGAPFVFKLNTLIHKLIWAKMILIQRLDTEHLSYMVII